MREPITHKEDVMVKAMLAHLRRQEVGPQQQEPALMPDPLPAQRPLLELASCWPWLALGYIVWLHPGWTADQIAELLAVFTPYIMLSVPGRRG